MSDKNIVWGLFGLGCLVVYLKTLPANNATNAGAALSNGTLPTSQLPAGATPGTGPLFPVPNVYATTDIPYGYMVYAVNSDPDQQAWVYPDTNGFEHIVVGLTDVVFLNETTSRAFNRRTGEITNSTTDHKPALTPMAVKISLDGLGRTPKVVG